MKQSTPFAERRLTDKQPEEKPEGNRHRKAEQHLLGGYPQRDQHVIPGKYVFPDVEEVLLTPSNS